jgi:hypothetical protein
MKAILTGFYKIITKIQGSCSFLDKPITPLIKWWVKLNQAYEHDRQLMQEQDKNNLALELRVLHDRLTNAYRRLVL